MAKNRLEQAFDEAVANENRQEVQEMLKDDLYVPSKLQMREAFFNGSKQMAMVILNHHLMIKPSSENLAKQRFLIALQYGFFDEMEKQLLAGYKPIKLSEYHIDLLIRTAPLNIVKAVLDQYESLPKEAAKAIEMRDFRGDNTNVLLSVTEAIFKKLSTEVACSLLGESYYYRELNTVTILSFAKNVDLNRPLEFQFRTKDEIEKRRSTHHVIDNLLCHVLDVKEFWLAKVFINAGADVNTNNNSYSGRMPIHIAIMRGAEEQVIKLLIEKGAKLDVKAIHTPLELALRYERINIVELLIDERAKGYENVLHLALKNVSADSLHQVIEGLLKIHGVVEITEKDHAKSVKTLKAAVKKPDVLELLLKSGIQAGASEALVSAANSGNIDSVKLLLEHGAKVEMNQNGDLSERYKNKADEVVNLLQGALENQADYLQLQIEKAEAEKKALEDARKKAEKEAAERAKKEAEAKRKADEAAEQKRALNAVKPPPVVGPVKPEDGVAMPNGEGDKPANISFADRAWEAICDFFAKIRDFVKGVFGKG